MKVELLFPSKYLSAADLVGKGEPTVTIESVFMDDLKTRDGKTERKPLIRFRGAKKDLVLNKTNAMIIAGLYGKETDNWIGRPVTLTVARVEAFGKLTDAVRVKDELPVAPVVRPAAAQIEQPVAQSA